jgi:hypothetical protein
MHAQAGIAELCEQTNAANELTLALNSCQGLTSSIRKPKTLPNLAVWNSALDELALLRLVFALRPAESAREPENVGQKRNL